MQNDAALNRSEAALRLIELGLKAAQEGAQEANHP
jgi:hypothetical protein